MDINGVTVLHTSEGHELDLTQLHIRQMIPLKGGTLIIKDLPEFPPVSCNKDNCYEFATTVSLIAGYDEDHYIVFHCKDHYDELLKLAADHADYKIVH